MPGSCICSFFESEGAGTSILYIITMGIDELQLPSCKVIRALELSIFCSSRESGVYFY